MAAGLDKLSELLAATEGHGASVSRATSPGGGPREMDGMQKSRNRPRTFPYFRTLPYEVEDIVERQDNLEEILKNLYVAIEAGDFAPGAIHWTRELRSWLNLKFDPTKEQRAKLVHLYYELALAPGIDPSTSDRFASMFMLLTKRKHYLRPIEELKLDWRPLFKELKAFVLPSEGGVTNSVTSARRSIKTLTKLATFSQLYFDPKDIPEMLETFLPYFSLSFSEGAFVVTGLLNIMLPTTPAPEEEKSLYPQEYLPSLFHLWSLVSRSKTIDVSFLDQLSRIARDSLPAKYVPFSDSGIFTKEQSTFVFTAVLRLLEIPVGQSTSPYSGLVDVGAGLGVLLERDSKKHPVSHHIARWIVMSLSPACLETADSILVQLEGLIQAVETFFHPSNSGAWTKNLAQLVYYLSDFFVMRWNRERSGEMEVPEERKLNEEVKRRFVLCLREVIFMGIYAKSPTAMSFSLSTLSNLAYLDPGLILPGALQRIYPSMQGLVEVHRTTSSLRSLQALCRTLVRTKGFRCHVTTLLGLAIPGIDPNDLDKTLHTLSFIQTVCYNIPMEDLTKGTDVSGNMAAVQWVTNEVERMEVEGAGVKLDYADTLSDEDELTILRSSTTGFAEFLTSFLGRVFTLLENLPDAARIRGGSPEENVINTLPATFTPLLASLSPELYDVALSRILDFVSRHVIHQARDAMAFICNCVCMINPEKALKKFVPLLIGNIRTEIDENGAASTRNTGTDVLPRDRALVWNVSMLSMCIVHVGDAVLRHKQELFDIAVYMQKHCRGVPTVHISNYIHHLLLSLTSVYTLDYSLFEDDVLERGIQPGDWGRRTDPEQLNIKWHVPSKAEIEFAVELFESQAGSALENLKALLAGTSGIKRDGTGKDWSDELARSLVLIRLCISGISSLFDASAASNPENKEPSEDVEMSEANGHVLEDNQHEENDTLDQNNDDEVKPTFKYPIGYSLEKDDPLYQTVHATRERAGHVLHDTHDFLCKYQEDDVSCFNPLYTAYKCWFMDVGIERTAHVLDRVTRLYTSAVGTYKISGQRKDYPRPLLVQRAKTYALQRLRHNASPRPRSQLDETLLLDLAQSCVSIYTEIRRTAQNAGEAAMKVIIGARMLVVPSLLEALEKAVAANDFPRIKGGLFSLLFGTLAKPIGRNWRYTPSLIRSYINCITVDKPSIQKLCSGATFQILDFGRPMERVVFLDQAVVNTIGPSEDVDERISKKREQLKLKRAQTEKKKAELADELVDVARTSYWKKASRAATVVISLGLRFEKIASENMIDLVTTGTIDSHPGLRGIYSQTLVALFSTVDMRALYDHKYENYIQDKQDPKSKYDVATKRDQPDWTDEYLTNFAKPDAEYFVDHDYPGWLVWDKVMPVYKAHIARDHEYDEVETAVRTQMGKLFTRDWFKTFFGYLKQEPRDSMADRFRMASAMMLMYVFELMVRDEMTAATFEELKEEIMEVYGDGSDKHQHRATAEIMGGLISSVIDSNADKRKLVWEFAFPIVQKIFSDGLTPENASYWNTFLHMIVSGRDPRRAWPLVEWLANFRLDMSSNAAFKESSKIHLLQQSISDVGWHFQLDKPIVEDFLSHIDHPYKGVREAMGQTLGMIFRTRYHESFKDVPTFMAKQKATSSIGVQPYRPTEEFTNTITEVFERLEKWRHEREPGQQTPSSYTSGSKTVLLWLDSTLSSFECTSLLQFFPNVFLSQLLHMMDVKEDPELQSLAYHVFRHLPNIPHRVGEDSNLVDALISIGHSSPSWHQRLRVMINMQIMYFRRLFLLSPQNREKLFNAVASMLEDTQHEVRAGASATLSGMIRCSPQALRTGIVDTMKARFTKMLSDNPLPKKTKAKTTATSSLIQASESARSSGLSTPTPEHTKLIITRHAAVLGLGALVQAFPYTSPPPTWMPEVLITLSSRAAGDPGIVGQSVKSIISDFKKTRQDTWHIDVKVSLPLFWIQRYFCFLYGRHPS